MARAHQQGWEARGLDLLLNYLPGGAPVYVSFANAYAYLGIGYGLRVHNGGIGVEGWAIYEVPAHAQSDEVYIRIMMLVHYVTHHGGLTNMTIYDENSNAIIRLTPSDGDIEIIGVSQGNIGVQTEDVYARWEFYIKCANSGGVVTIWKDGVEVFTYTGDTQPAATTDVARIEWRATEQLTRYWYIDDIAYNDIVDDGRGNDTWPGPGKIYGFRPSGLGPFAEWGSRFPNGGEANWEDVDDGVPDDDSTFVQSTAPGQRDAHITENTPVGAFVVRSGCVQWSVNAKIIGTGPDQIASYIVKDGVPLEGNSRTPGASYTATHYLYDMLPTRPDGGEWLTSDVDNTQFGYKAT